MEPLSAAPQGAPAAPGNVVYLAPFLEQLASQLQKPDMALLPGATLPGDDELTIHLSEEHLTALARELQDIRTAHDTSMVPRLMRWKELKEAYNLVPDPRRQGQKPDASKLVSGVTRSQVNTASARLEESILGVRPFIKFDVWFENEDDPETLELVDQAKAAEEFFEGYSEADLEVPRWLPAGIHRSCKLGTCVCFTKWKVETRTRRFRKRDGKFEKTEDRYGRIHVALVPNEDVIAWPLHESEIDRMLIFGHRTRYTPAEFRAWAKSVKLPKERVDRIIACSLGDGEGSTPLSDDLAGKDIRTAGQNPFKGQVEIEELWCDMALPGEDTPRKFQVFCHERSPLQEQVLWLGEWAYHSGIRPYFDLQYWIEDGSYWGSGVGHELVYTQAADSSLLNLLVDNLKIISNHLRLVKAGTTAEALADQIGPGYNLVTDDPEKDIKIVALGGDLSHIYNAIDHNEQRGMKLTGVTPPLQGMGDPVLKSGASPSSLQMLINEANQKFGKVDKNMRRSLSRAFAFFLDLIQQYAPDGLIYARAPEKQGDQLRRLRYSAPAGDLSRKFRIRVEAPTATSNREVLKQNVMVIFQLTMGYVQAILGLAGQVLGQSDPAGLQQFSHRIAALLNELYLQVVTLHEVPGIAGIVPKFPEPTPANELINQLMAQVQQLQMQLQQVMAAGGGGGQQPMGAPGAQPGLQGPVPAPQGAGAAA